MIDYMKYGPYICIGVVLAILFVLWAFYGGKNYEFVGLGPLDPNKVGSYTGSIYNWGDVTQATKSEDIDDFVCHVDKIETTNIQDEITNIKDDTSAEVICVNEIEVPKKKSKRFVSKGERICCQTMEKIYGVPFNSIRPKWLQNPETGYNLELDCYNDDLKIAVEYNGEQHYKWPNFTNQTYEQFINQVRRDDLKFKLCNRNGVYLIVVPYNIPHDKISSYIVNHLPETIQKRITTEIAIDESMDE